MSKIIFVIILSILFITTSCSQKVKMTSSKIKFVAGNIFSGGNSLSTKANKGLIFYGKSNDGKTFTKKINDDSVDIQLPNGIWNFYAVSWENNGADGLLSGNNYCAKSEGVRLSGPDVALDLKLTNSNCADPMFTSAAKTENSKNILSAPNLVSCQNISGVGQYTDNANCYSNLTTGSNKGYATYIKIVIPEYKSFMPNEFAKNSNAIESDCFQIDDQNPTGELTPTDLSKLNSARIPHPGATGLAIGLEVYYSATGCDVSRGLEKYYVKENSFLQSNKIKQFIDSSSSTNMIRFFVETNENDVCKPPRLSPSSFASGFGGINHPYTICNKEQYEILADQFSTYNRNSFDLLTDIDFKFSHPKMIGELQTNGMSVSYFGGNDFNSFSTFNGKNHKIKNALFKCETGSAAQYFGMFRKTQNLSIKNLTISHSAMMCESKNDIGLLLGKAIDTKLDNIKIHGFVEGLNEVGGVAGDFIAQNANGAEIKNTLVTSHVKGNTYVGGLAGYTSFTSGMAVTKSVFSGEVEAKSNGSPIDSYVGGIFGLFTATGATSIDQVVVKSERINGSKIIGGIAGKATNLFIQNSYVTAILTSSDYTDGSIHFVQMGGMIGLAINGSIQKSFALNLQKANRHTSDSTYGGLVGAVSGTSPSCIGAYYSTSTVTEVVSGLDATCTSTTAGKLATALITNNTYINASYDATKWTYLDNGFEIPRLQFESDFVTIMPSLRRDCAGKSAGNSPLGGSGTASDPYWICSTDQFNNMLAGQHYILKKSLLFLISTTPKTSGVYYLNGNNHSLINVNISLNSFNGSYGIFSELQAGSYVKNLNIINSKIYSSAAVELSTASAGSYIGLLAGKNYGTISNVNLKNNNELTYTNVSLTGSSTFAKIGGLVGLNGSSGIIEKSSSDVFVEYKEPVTTGADSHIIAGSMMAFNQGLVQGVKGNGTIKRYSSLPSTNITSNEIIGGIIGLNSGTLKEISFEGKLDISNYSSTDFSQGTVSPFVAKNTGSISDFMVSPNVSFSYYEAGASSFYFLPNNTGSVTRGFLYPRDDMNNNLSTNFQLTPAGGAGSIADLNCFYSTQSGPCRDINTHTFEVDQATNLFGIYDSSLSNILANPANWKVAIGPGFDSQLVWRILDPNDNHKIPELINASGNFDEIGPGF